MESIGISELLVVGVACALFTVPVVAGIVILVTVLGKRGKQGRSGNASQLGAQNESI